MHLEYPAHVDHKVAHTSVAGRIGLTLAGAAIGAAIVMTGGVAAGAAALILNFATIGRFLGDIADHVVLPPGSHTILTGYDRLMLGTQQKHAARANPDTTIDCGDIGFEGSELVMVGSEFAPMSRREDRDSGNGVIVEGVESIIVGGDPSMKGKDIADNEGMVLPIIDAILAAAGIGVGLADARKAGTLAEWARFAAGTTGTAASYAGYEDAGGAIGALSNLRSPFDGSTVDAITQGIGAYEGTQSAAALVTGG